MSYRLLLASTDATMYVTMQQYFINHNFAHEYVTDGKSALQKILSQTFDIIIIDLLLPEMNGFNLLIALREHSTMPVLILTSRQDDADCILAFKLGANDYLRKPCHPLEIMTRTERLLIKDKATKHSIFQYKTIIVDSIKRQATQSGQELVLTNTEFNILETLIRHPEQALSKEALTDIAIGRKYTAFDRSIDVHISHLRTKLGKNPAGKSWISTVRGFGYLLQDKG